MAAVLLEGRPIADKLKSALASEVADLKSKHKRAPKLVAIQVGADASAAVYARNQRKVADSIGIEYDLVSLDAASQKAHIKELIMSLNADRDTSGVILQLPLPAGLDAKNLLGLISPEKDAEGMHPENIAKLIFGGSAVAPCTAKAVMCLIEASGAEIYGKEAVVVGHSEIVGRPIALMLMEKFATTTVCHIATSERGNLPEHVRQAEILVAAVGKAALIRGDWVRPGAVVIDVGINRVADKLVGDVEFERAREKAAFITPVPGGVGAVTTVMLMKNVVELFKAGL